MVNEKILIVEDEELIGQDIKFLLEDLGYQVPAIVPSGEEAIYFAGETQADLVLMDIMLEGKIDGIEAAEHINNHFGIPIIYLTAYRNEEIMKRAKQTEPYAYIIKPFEERELRNNVEIVLNRHRANKEKLELINVTSKNEFLKRSLQEKEILLREIHHRVNNNMQIISSLLSLQIPQIKDDRDMHLFIDSQNRVKSMAKVHERLYQSKDSSSIAFADYCISLLKDLFGSHTAGPGIKLEVEIEDISFNMETAIPCGLIINELVSNSLKHAFSHDVGEISVNLIRVDENRFQLTISDNGIGLPEDIDFKNTSSLGLRLTNNLTSQLEGEIELEKVSGTKFIIKFSELKYETRSEIKDTLITAYKSKELRKEAAELLNENKNGYGNIPNNFKELIRDLKIHQIEIEMQRNNLKKYENRLFASQKKYSNLFNHAPVGYLTLKENGKIVDVNNTGTILLGVSKLRLINLPFKNLLKPESKNIFSKKIQKAHLTGITQKFNIEIVSSENDNFRAYIETNPLYDEKGNFLEFQITLIDPLAFNKNLT